MTNRNISPHVVDSALEELRVMLATDGYTLTWSEISPGKISVNIEAGADACAECLVPQAVMKSLMEKALTNTSYEIDDVTLPVNH